MIRITLSAETSKALEDMIEKLNQLTPAQAGAFNKRFAEELKLRSHDDKSARWLNEAIDAYERRTGHKL